MDIALVVISFVIVGCAFFFHESRMRRFRKTFGILNPSSNIFEPIEDNGYYRLYKYKRYMVSVYLTEHNSFFIKSTMTIGVSLYDEYKSMISEDSSFNAHGEEKLSVRYWFVIKEKYSQLFNQIVDELVTKIEAPASASL